jgi:hypothetical protein
MLPPRADSSHHRAPGIIVAAAFASMVCSQAWEQPVIEDFFNESPRGAFSTLFEGCQAQMCACGVPPELLQDEEGNPVPFVALNVQNTDMLDAVIDRPYPEDSGKVGMFINGRNCGRWIEITFLENCNGWEHEAHHDPPGICGVNAYEVDPMTNYNRDGYSGNKAYAVVADSCQEGSYWYGAPFSSRLAERGLRFMADRACNK